MQNISYIYIFIIQNNFIRVYDGNKYLELFGPEIIILFTKGLDIL